MINIYSQIISSDNILKAYLNLSQKMEEDGRSWRYRGWDNISLVDIENDSGLILEEIKEEMISCQEISPAPLFLIPKKNNPSKKREIFIYKIKDRIKAQAIFQVIEKYFDSYLSDYLFSYRSSHPSYLAARSTARHYHRYWERNFILVADVSDYTGHIRQDILLKKIEKIGFDKKTLALINLFIDNTALREGKLVKPEHGLVLGTPLIALFYNIYLDDFDKFCGSKVDFYRRVGDDLIVLDKKQERIDIVYKQLIKETESLGISIHKSKGLKGEAKETFTYLGYKFKQGQITFSDSFIKNTIKGWKQQFSFSYSKNKDKKRKLLQQSIYREKNNLKNQFRQLAEQKKLVDDQEAIKKLSESFFHVLTKFFFGKYNPKNRRLLTKYTKNLGIVTLYRYFLTRQHGYGKNKKK